jgi:hypothetical protein
MCRVWGRVEMRVGLIGKHEGKRTTGTYSRKWYNNIKIAVKEIDRDDLDFNDLVSK